MALVLLFIRCFPFLMPSGTRKSIVKLDLQTTPRKIHRLLTRDNLAIDILTSVPVSILLGLGSEVLSFYEFALSTFGMVHCKVVKALKNGELSYRSHFCRVKLLVLWRVLHKCRCSWREIIGFPHFCRYPVHSRFRTKFIQSDFLWCYYPVSPIVPSDALKEGRSPSALKHTLKLYLTADADQSSWY